MSISHRTNRLKLVGQPSVEQLQNGRYRLTVNCTALNTRNDWYSANKDRIFPDYGSLQSAEMSIDGLAPREGEAYADMRLTKVESGNRSMRDGGDYLVVLTYETVGSSFVQVKDDNTDYELNGLRRVTRTSIAEVGTDYARTVGTSYIDHQIDSEAAVRCYLASYGIDDTDSFRQVQEVYVEAGILSKTLDNVGSQKAEVIETIGTDPIAPSGYSLASKQESNFEGFQTNRFTFLKDNVVLSESEDSVGSQLAIVKEVFNGTPTTPSGYLLANTQVSDVGGIPTRRYTFLKPSVLSESTDYVGSQKAKVIETFSLAPTNPEGYSLANEQKSDVGGIPTKRHTFLRPSILSLQQNLVGGDTTVQVSAFGMTEAEVDTALSEVTASHILISQSEGDYEGIITSQFTYEVDDFEERDRIGNDLLRIQETELSASKFLDGDVGTTTKTDGATTLYLGSESIDNSSAVKRRIRMWMEAGTLNISTTTESTGLNRVSTTFLHIEGTTNGPIVSRSEQNVLGLKTITVSTLERSDGKSITDETPTNTFGAMFNFTYPGVVGASRVTTKSMQNGVVVDNAVNRFFYQSSPVERPIPATSYVFFQLSSLPVTADYVYKGASGLWSPSEWAGGVYYGWRYQRDNFGTPIGERPSFRGFRAVENDSEVENVFTSLTGTATDDDGLSGTLLLNGTTFEISVSGGPEKPDGNIYTLGTIDIEPAFIDEDGVQYYKKVITVATIPDQGGSVIT